MKPIKFLFSLLTPLLAMQSPVMGQAPSPGVMPTNRLSFTTKGFLAMSQGAEIPAYDAASKRVFVSSNAGIQVVDLTNPAAPVELPIITPTAHGLPSNDVASVTVKNGVLAACMISVPKTVPGHVAFFTASTGAFLGSVVVGANPDHLTFTPDGTKVLVCNEGELDGTAAVISADTTLGSVGIINVSGGFAAPTVTTADFTSYDSQAAALKAAGVRLFQGGVPSTDFEPEYLAVSPDSTKAMVVLQEANALAVLDIATATFTSVVPLGEKDFSTLLADFSDRDGPSSGVLKKLTTGNPVFGLYMPDNIAAYQSQGQTYYVTANEGDDRDDFLNPDETIRVSSGSYVLDPTVFPNAATLKSASRLGRLTVSNAPGLRGDIDNDGDVDRILAYGPRSFSIHDANGRRVFDSGDMLERIVADQFPANFDDTRSDNKGPEPEGVTVATIGGRTYAFVGQERSHMVMIFDVTNPADVVYTGAAIRPGDLNPEGLVVVSATDSPSGKPLLITASEVSNTLSIFEIEERPGFTLQLLHLSDAEAGLLASQTAPNLAAMVDAYDQTYSNTLILAGGDNFLPGPFLNAGTDPLVGATHNKGSNPAAADIEIHNRLGVEASTIGNHEFDLGTNAFSDAINDAQFPYLSANLDFSGDAALSGRYQETVGAGGLEEASTLARKIVPSAVVTKGGEKIGLVGATTQIIEAISSTGGVEVKGFVGDGSERDDMVLLASQLQPVIDDLKNQGVNKIILMAHLQQIANEVILAPMLRDVDIILAAGSNTRLGDSNDVSVAFAGHAATFAGNYPIYTTGADGRPVVVVNTDNEFTYLGRLVADFDADGVLIVPTLEASAVTNGAYAATAANVAAAWGVQEAALATTAFAPGTKGSLVKQITDAVQGVINAKDGTVYGYTSVYLEGERNFVRNQETNLGNITADSMITAAQTALGAGTPHILSLKNGGGIRAQIGSVDVVTGAKTPPIANPGAGKPAGAISLLDIENSLRFNNRMMVFDTTPAGLKAILEHGVAVLGGQGRFPQIGGIRFSFDSALPAGSRVRSLALTDVEGRVLTHVMADGVMLPSAPAALSLVTLNFLANGGDGYPMKANGENFRYLLDGGTLSAPVDESLDFTSAANLPVNLMGEQTALIQHLSARHATPDRAFSQADVAISLDQRIQQLQQRSDTVLGYGPISLTEPVFSFQQGQAIAQISLTRIGTEPTTVTLQMQDGMVSTNPPFAPAVAGVDYISFNGRPGAVISFAANQTTRTVSLPLIPSLAAQSPNKRFSVTLTAPTDGSSLGSLRTASVEIIAVDTSPPALIVTDPLPSTSTLSAALPYRVRGITGDTRGVDRVEISLNGGAPVEAELGASTTSNKVPFSLAITPIAGAPNTLIVTAYNLAGTTTTVTRTFTLERRYQLTVGRTAPAGVSLSTAGSMALTVAARGLATPLSQPFPTGTQTSSILPGAVVSIHAFPAAGYFISHWTGLPSGAIENRSIVTFTMPTEDVPAVVAHFIANPFVGPVGSSNSFYGVIEAQAGTTEANETEGFMMGTLDPVRGSFTGRLLMGGVSQSFVSYFYGDGSAQFNVLGNRQPSVSLGGRTLTMSLAAGRITASITHATGSSAGILRRGIHSRSHPVPAGMLNQVISSSGAGRRGFYTVALPSKTQSPARPLTTYPQGDGYGSIFVSEIGMVTLSGLLADGSSFTASTALVEGLQSPAFSQIITPGAASSLKGGSLSGMFTFDASQADSDVSATDLRWFRPAVAGIAGSTRAALATQVYTAGWPTGIRVDAIGAQYDNEVDVQAALGLAAFDPVLGNAELLISQGKLSAELQIGGFNITPGSSSDMSRVTKLIPSDVSFSLFISQTSGFFSGHFSPDWTSRSRVRLRFRGVLLQKGASKGCYGYFISYSPSDLNPESGRVTLGAP